MSSRSRNIAFMACPEEDFAALVSGLSPPEAQDPWLLVCFYSAPVPVPARFKVIVISQGLWTALGLWGRCLIAPHRIVICCHDGEARSGLQSLIDFVSVCRARDRTLLDIGGRRELIAAARPGKLATIAVVPVLWLVATVVTRANLALRGGGERARPVDPSRGFTAMLVPILPDLSHTFVYREVAEVKRRQPDYLVLALDRGRGSVVHTDAADLLSVTEFVPQPSAARYLLMYLGLWIRHPKELAALIRFLQPQTAQFGPGGRSGDALCFLRLEYLHHSNYLISGLVLADFLRRKGITRVHVYGSTNPSLRALIAHRLLGISYSVSTYADFEYPVPFHMLEAKFGHARFILTCSDFCRTRLIERLPEVAAKTHVLRPSIPREFGGSPIFRPKDGHSRIVYVGRFVPKKGLDTLIRACSILRDSRIDTQCHLYGGGPEMERLDRLVKELGLADFVFMHEGVRNDRLYSTMNRDDIFVCASRYMPDGERDGLPVTLIEAMAVGVTVVSTPVAGIPELVEDGRNGYLVPPDDPVRLAETLAGLLVDPLRRQAVQAEAQRTVRDRFALEDAGGQLAEWLRVRKSP